MSFFSVCYHRWPYTLRTWWQIVSRPCSSVNLRWSKILQMPSVSFTFPFSPFFGSTTSACWWHLIVFGSCQVFFTVIVSSLRIDFLRIFYPACTLKIQIFRFTFIGGDEVNELFQYLQPYIFTDPFVWIFDAYDSPKVKEVDDR